MFLLHPSKLESPSSGLRPQYFVKEIPCPATVDSCYFGANIFRGHDQLRHNPDSLFTEILEGIKMWFDVLDNIHNMVL